jgi:hypothetical protein
MKRPSDLELAESKAERRCILPAIPAIANAARYLDAAVSAHISGHRKLAEELIVQADIPEIRDWAETLWGKANQFNRPQGTPGLLNKVDPSLRDTLRKPTAILERELHRRYSFHCGFCGIPVIRKQVRDRFRKLYPNVIKWGPKYGPGDKHAAFLAMWAAYDHLKPHSRGGRTELGNLVVACAPCNFGRGEYTIEQFGLSNPLAREPISSAWDGLERLLCC